MPVLALRHTLVLGHGFVVGLNIVSHGFEQSYIYIYIYTLSRGLGALAMFHVSTWEYADQMFLIQLLTFFEGDEGN